VGGRLGAIALAQLGEPLLAPAGDHDLGGLAPAGAEQAGEESLPDPPAAEDRNLALVHARSLSRARRRARDQSPCEAHEEVDAREPRPLAVRLEQLRGLPCLDVRPAAQRAQELDEAEVADEAMLEAAQSFEADDGGRPRPEAALALD